MIRFTYDIDSTGTADRSRLRFRLAQLATQSLVTALDAGDAEIPIGRPVRAFVTVEFRPQPDVTAEASL